MNLPGCISQKGGDVMLAVKAQPRAPRNEICGCAGNELKVKVTAPPVDSAANEALLLFLAETLGCPRNRVELARGQTSRHKLLRIHRFRADDVAAKLSLTA